MRPLLVFALGCGSNGMQRLPASDSDAPVDTPTELVVATPVPSDAGPHGYRCDEVGVAPGDGIFSLAAFEGQLYAGQFGYGLANTSMLWRFPNWEQVTPGITGVEESICAMEVFEGAFYANTESSGDIFRSTDGQTWTLVHDGAPGVIGCGLHVFEGALYAVNFNYGTQRDGSILRSVDGGSFETAWSGTSPDWSPYLREITSHDGVLYAYGTNTQTDQGFWLSSPNGEDWTLTETPSRFFRGLSWNGALYSSSTDYSSNGPAGIYRTEDGITTQVHSTPKHYVTELKAWDDGVFAGTSAGWKDDVGTSSLLMSRDGASWQPVCDFDEVAAWSLEVQGDELFVGTWEFGGAGKLYRVQIDPNGEGIDPPETPVDDCAVDPANPPVQRDLLYTQATYTNRHNWVLTCYPYAYTASNYEEHHPCDPLFEPDGSRTGTAVFDFLDVPRGRYHVEIQGRHTASRNPAGALFIVDGHSVAIDQLDDSNDFFWDTHGTWCLEGDIQAVLDSTVNGGSDDVVSIRLTPSL